MTKHAPVLVLLLLGVVLVLGTGACGGGGGGTPPVATDAFNGTYWMGALTCQAAAPDVAQAVWGTMVADGLGTLGGGFSSSNTNGTVTGPMPGGGDSPYAFDANGRLLLDFGGITGAVGGLASDGSAAAFASTFAPIDPLVYVLCRRGGSFNLNSLDGLYHFALFAYDPSGMQDIARWGTLTCNSGAATVSRMNNVSGLVSSTLPAAGNYFVAADGTLDITLVGESFRGGVLQGGALAVGGGTTTNGGNPTLLLLVRGSTAASLATFTGTYHAVGIEAPIGGTPEWISYTTTATADGAGSFDVHAGLQNADAVITALPAMATMPYTVAANGTLSIAGGNVIGGVSPTGRYAFYAGSTMGGQAPLLWFLLR